MTGPNSDFAYQQYAQQTGLANLFGFGLFDIQAAAKAVSAANEAQALSVDPQVVDSMVKKLTQMEETLGTIQAESRILNSETKLGGGYAQQVSGANKQIGEKVIDQLVPDMVLAVKELKSQIEKSRASYQNVEDARANTFKNL